MGTLLKTGDEIRRRIAIFLLYVLTFALPAVSHADVKQVAIVPLKINAEKDLSSLRDGIMAMLSSRMSWRDRVIVTEPGRIAPMLGAGAEPANEAVARDIGHRLSVDYVVFGSLTFPGNGMRIDLKVADLSREAPVHSFYRESPDMDGVIPEVARLAEAINKAVFGRIAAIRSAPVKADRDQSSIHAHPESLWGEEQRAAPGKDR